MTDEELALLRAICEQPDDDNIRLIAADWHEDNGQAERAEFIRLQIEIHRRDAPSLGEMKAGAYQRGAESLRLRERALWLSQKLPSWFGESLGVTYSRNTFALPHDWPCGFVERGFVTEISCTLAEFMDWVCDCDRGVIDTGAETPWGWPINDRCPNCDGNGVIKGLASILFGEHPIIAVRLTNRNPLRQERSVRPFSWHRMGLAAATEFDIPDELFYLIPESKRTGNYSFHSTTMEAISDLSSAAVNYARKLHGLPLLTR